MGIKFNPLSGQFDLVGSSTGGGAVDSVNGQTGVVVLDTGDVASVVDSRYVTDAQLTVIGNTSGTNTGDVSVTDSSEIDFTLAGQNITASIVAGSIDETKLDASTNASLDLADSALQAAAIGVTVQAYSAVLAATTASFLLADETKLDAITGTNTGDQTSIVGISGTIAQFNTACTDADFATGGGTASGTNTGDQASIVGISGTMAEFNTAVSDGNILFNDAEGLGFRFENRTSDPGTPTVGQVWLRTDL